MSKFNVGDYVELVRTDMYLEWQGKQQINIIDGHVLTIKNCNLRWDDSHWKLWVEKSKLKVNKFKLGDFVVPTQACLENYPYVQDIYEVASLEDNNTCIFKDCNNIWNADWFDLYIGKDDPGKHYRFQYKEINLDPFRIANIYGLDFPQSTILKKVLRTGKRGHKDTIQDYKDIICAAQRAIEMIEEDNEIILNT